MEIIIDTREHDLYEKITTLPQEKNVTIVKQTLPLGDIILRRDNAEILVIERKTIDDLIASTKDGRYTEQSYRLYNTVENHHNVVYLLEGAVLPIKKKLVYGAITSLAFFKGFSVIRTTSVTDTAELIMNFARKIEKDWRDFTAAPAIRARAGDAISDDEDGNTTTPVLVTEPAQPIQLAADVISTLPTPLPSLQNPKNYVMVVKKVKKENLTQDNMSEVMLSQIPGVGPPLAIQIIQKYNSLGTLMDSLRAEPTCLDNFKVDCLNGKKRKINKSAVDSIKTVLLGGGAAADTSADNTTDEVTAT
jgi:ERCC4-type nuclease